MVDGERVQAHGAVRPRDATCGAGSGRGRRTIVPGRGLELRRLEGFERAAHGLLRPPSEHHEPRAGRRARAAGAPSSSGLEITGSSRSPMADAAPRDVNAAPELRRRRGASCGSRCCQDRRAAADHRAAPGGPAKPSPPTLLSAPKLGLLLGGTAADAASWSAREIGGAVAVAVAAASAQRSRRRDRGGRERGRRGRGRPSAWRRSRTCRASALSLAPFRERVVDAAALGDGDLAVVDGEDVDLRVAVDVKALVVPVILEDEERRVRREHAVARRERDDLLLRGRCAVLRRVDEALNLRLRPGALDERPLDRAEIGVEGLGRSRRS